MADRLAGRVAIVTGAGSRSEGIGNGKATAILFAREGARVLCVDQVIARAQETVDAISSEGGEATAFAADVTKVTDCEAMVAASLNAYGDVDILHNNVGISSTQGVGEITEDEWDQVLAVNLKSMVLTTQAALPALERSGRGAIINISSIAGLRYSSGMAVKNTAYAASKAAIVGLTTTMAGQLAPKHIRVNCIAPGQVYTPMVAGRIDQETRQKRRLAGLLQTEGTGWDIGWAAVYLASEEARWVTGQVIAVDAGVTITTR